MCGCWEEATESAKALSSSKHSPEVRARATAILGAICSSNSKLEAADRHFREARKALQQIGSHERACEVGLRHFSSLLDVHAGTSVENLSSELQKEVVRLGNRRLLCMFHVAAANFHTSVGRID
jgi:hypothetical protein